MKEYCYWYHQAGPGYCCWGIDPAGFDSEELWAGPESYSHGLCSCGGDPRSRDCLFSDKKPWQKTQPYPWSEEEYMSHFSVWDYENEKNVLKEYKGNNPEPSLPGRIRKIEAWAFSHNVSITGIYLPKLLTQIGENAFNGCKNLTCVTIPSKVVSIGEYAFHMCSSLKRVDFEKCDEPLLTKIGANAFCGCGALKEIIIPWGPEKLCCGAFWGCSALEMACLGPGANSIERLAFANCPSLRAVFIPESVTEIDDEAFVQSPELTIVGAPGSYAEMWADKHKVIFHTVFD